MEAIQIGQFIEDRSMRTNERTLLTSLGFNDVDKHNPIHDLACQYVMQPKVAEHLLKNETSHLSEQDRVDICGHAQSEFHLVKGEGRYTTTIGFLDVIWKWGYFPVVVEVKIQEIPIGDVLRQINLYAEYAVFPDCKKTQFILVAPWRLDSTDIEYLARAGIRFARLGPCFDAYVEERKKAKKAEQNTPDVEIDEI